MAVGGAGMDGVSRGSEWLRLLQSNNKPILKYKRSFSCDTPANLPHSCALHSYCRKRFICVRPSAKYLVWAGTRFKTDLKMGFHSLDVNERGRVGGCWALRTREVSHIEDWWNRIHTMRYFDSKNTNKLC